MAKPNSSRHIPADGSLWSIEGKPCGCATFKLALSLKGPLACLCRVRLATKKFQQQKGTTQVNGLSLRWGENNMYSV